MDTDGVKYDAPLDWDGNDNSLTIGDTSDLTQFIINGSLDQQQHR